jgi:class 3 adenylate cyclase/tetratricopeptide (TPR) repeat protein
MDEREQIKEAIVSLESQRPLLGNAAVDVILSALNQKLAAFAQPAPPQPEELAGERKLVTVMFADISGFTAFAEIMDAEQVRALMNDCFDALVPQVERYGGTVDKFIGDEIMALFGAPVAYENHAERALLAALAMTAALDEFNARQGSQLGIHFGVNTGMVVAGGIGSAGRQQYSVMGDTVNLASRLQDASEKGEIFVGPASHRLTAPLFDFDALPPLQLKGKAAAVPVYRLRGRKATPDAVRGFANLRSPLLGRAAEMEQLRQAVQQVGDGRGQLILVLGEAGLGKSRLVAEVRQLFTGRVHWVEGRALSYMEGVSYWVARDILYNLVGVGPETTPQAAAVALRAHLQELFPEQLAAVYPFPAQMAGLPLEPDMEPHVKHLSPEALQKRLRRAFADWLRALCARQPVVLVWEDLHWADASSRGLLETLLPLTGEIPLLLLLVARRHEGWLEEWYERAVTAAGRPSLLLTLNPLDSQASRQMIYHLLRSEALPDETRQLILSKAEGNPFFIEEVLRSLLDAGSILMDESRLVAVKPPDELKVPDTLQGVIAARIDRLPAEDKRVLQLAAVIGRVFQKPVLAHLWQEQPATLLDPCLEELSRREFIHQRQQVEYIFKHAVTQEVTYDGLLLERRRQLHRVTAEAIESLFPDRAQTLSATLAYHYQRAEMPAKAVDYLWQAAAQASQTFSNAEASAFYRTAVEQLNILQRNGAADKWRVMLAQSYQHLGDVAALIGARDEARAEYEHALAHTKASEGIARSQIHRKMGTTWLHQRLFDNALPHFEQAELALGTRVTGASADWSNEWIWLQLDRCWLYYWSNQVSRLEELMEQVRLFVEQRGSLAQKAAFYRARVGHAFRRDCFSMSDETLCLTEQHLAAAEAAGDFMEVTRALTTKGMCLVFMYPSRLDMAETMLQRALQMTEQSGDNEHMAITLTYLTMLYRRRGDVGRAREYALRSLEVAQAGKTPFYIGQAQANLGWVAWQEGQLAEGESLYRQATQTWAPALAMHFLARTPLLKLALERGHEAEAVDHARVLLTPVPIRLPEAITEALQTAVAAWECGRTGEARSSLAQAAMLATEMGYS